MNQPICVVFAGRQGLDDVESRYSIARIPEVSAYLREAQAFFDNIKTVDHNIDLFSFLNSSDNDFSMRPKLRSLVAAIVQVGLFQRYTKFYGNPSFMVGNNNGASALNVCTILPWKPLPEAKWILWRARRHLSSRSWSAVSWRRWWGWAAEGLRTLVGWRFLP